jgi:branched-subunit amino acid transport protein
MSLRPEILFLILGCALVTFILRVLPIAFLKKISPPLWFVQWLDLFPATIMAALVSATLLFPESHSLVWDDIQTPLIAFVPTLIIACLTRSLGATVLTGILAMFAVLELGIFPL